MEYGRCEKSNYRWYSEGTKQISQMAEWCHPGGKHPNMMTEIQPIEDGYRMNLH